MDIIIHKNFDLKHEKKSQSAHPEPPGFVWRVEGQDIPLKNSLKVKVKNK